MSPIRRALKFFRPDAPRIAAAGGLLLLAVLAGLLKPWPLALLVDHVLSGGPLPAGLPAADRPGALVWLAGLTLALHALQGGLAALQHYLTIDVGLNGLQRVRQAVYGRLLRLSLRFHQGHASGDVLYRATWDTYAFQTLFQQGVMTFATAGLSLALMVVVMARIHGPLTLAALAIVPLLVLSIRRCGRIMQVRGAAAQQADSQVAAQLQQSLAVLPLIQGHTREAEAQREFAAVGDQARVERRAQHGWELVYGLGVALVFGLGTALVLWLGGRQVLAGTLSVGELLVFLAYLAQLYEPLNQLSHMGATVATAGASAQRVFDLLEEQDEVREAAAPRAVVRTPPDAPADALVVRGALAFERVTFHYPGGREVLSEVSFTVPSGQCVGIIGASGVGKTTLLTLVPRFLDPTAGAITLDGADLRSLSLAGLRAQVALVLQEPLLLPATVAENLAYGRPGATPAAIEAAARAAQAHEFITRLPQGYQTRVGEGAARLSVGEKQRLNLARALLKDAPILLLDEPTSALDADSEERVGAGLREWRRGRTTLVVAHRLQTLQDVDRIIVLENGRVVEDGSPAELRERNGYYARLLREPARRPVE